MKTKKDNNLVLVNVGNKKYYFTSLTRAGRFLGLQSSSISWAIAHRNELTNNAGEKVTITLVDGSDIQYKYINN
jgi:hypothetical protein